MAKQALEGTRLNAFGMDPNDLVIVGLDTSDGPEHPLYDPRINLPLDEAMVLNIMTYGVLQAVKARKSGDVPELVDGRQRVRCAREANKRLAKAGSDTLKIPVMLDRGTDSRVFGIMVSANEHRHEDSPLGKADKLARFLALGNSEEDAQVAFGVSHQTVRNWIALLELAPAVRKMIGAGKLNASTAKELARLPREDQAEAAQAMIDTGTNSSGAKREVKARAAAKAGRPAEDGGYPPPRKSLVNRVLKANKKADVLTPDFVRGVRWILGDLSTSSISGLSELIRQIEGGAEE